MAETVRINGNKEQLTRWSNEEILAGIGYATLRAEAAIIDASILQGEAFLRGLEPQIEPFPSLDA